MEHVAVLAVSDHPICGEYLAAFLDVLCLQLSDVVNPAHPSAITNYITHRIAAYIKALLAGLDTLFVCCDSGESRSAAMAAAILRSDGADEDQLWRNPRYHPNPLVYPLLCNALAVSAEAAEVQAKQMANERALTSAKVK